MEVHADTEIGPETQPVGGSENEHSTAVSALSPGHIVICRPGGTLAFSSQATSLVMGTGPPQVVGIESLQLNIWAVCKTSGSPWRERHKTRSTFPFWFTSTMTHASAVFAPLSPVTLKSNRRYAVVGGPGATKLLAAQAPWHHAGR